MARALKLSAMQKSVLRDMARGNPIVTEARTEGDVARVLSRPVRINTVRKLLYHRLVAEVARLSNREVRYEITGRGRELVR